MNTSYILRDTTWKFKPQNISLTWLFISQSMEPDIACNLILMYSIWQEDFWVPAQVDYCSLLICVNCVKWDGLRPFLAWMESTKAPHACCVSFYSLFITATSCLLLLVKWMYVCVCVWERGKHTRRPAQWKSDAPYLMSHRRRYRDVFVCVLWFCSQGGYQVQ